MLVHIHDDLSSTHNGSWSAAGQLSASARGSNVRLGGNKDNRPWDQVEDQISLEIGSRFEWDPVHEVPGRTALTRAAAPAARTKSGLR